MKNKLIFRIISLFLIFTHLNLILFQNVSFAKGSTLPKNLPPKEETTAPPGYIPSKADYASRAPIKSSSMKSASLSSSSSYGSAPPKLEGANGFNLGALQAFQNDPFTGKATFSIPISVPSGRKGIQPSLALSYSSGSGNSIAGVGWNLELGSIERSTKKGTPKYDSSDTFVFNSGSSQTELVNIGGSEYRAKIESAFMKFTFNGSYWQVVDKSGTKYYFGQSYSSQQESGSNIFKWCLDKVIDLNNNYLTLNYTKDQNQIYPQLIQYTGNEATSLSPYFKVEFVYESRPDTFISFRPGFQVKTLKRLTDVLVKADTQLISRYHFNYTVSNLNLSLLSSAVQYGSDNTTTLPPVSFEYQAQDPGWQVTDKTLPTTYGAFDWTTTTLDLNNDGFIDYVTDNGTTAYLGAGDGSFTQANSWRIPGGMNFSNGYGDCGFRFADMNADGWVDLVLHFHSDGGTRIPYVWLNNKLDGWVRDDALAAKFPCEAYFIYNHHEGTPEWHEQIGYMLGDINADGLSDIVRARSDGHECYINNGNGWQFNSTYATPSDTDFSNGSSILSDINGDGLLDLVTATSSNKSVYINTGSGWQREDSLNIPNLSDINFPDGSTLMFDINSDGLSDIVVATSSNRRTFINKATPGNNWQEDASFALPEADFQSNATRVADSQGKAILDILINKSSAENKIYFNRNNILPAYLTKVNNGIGGTTEVTYKPSTKFINKGQDNFSDLPFPVYIVDTVTTHDSVNTNNSDLVSRYEYKDGLFDFTEREFRGFGFVKTIDAEGNFNETYFKQDAVFKGRPYKQETKDSSGKLLAKSENTWLATSPYPGVNFAYLSKTDNFVYNQDDSFKQTSSEFTYDTYGNPTQVISNGFVDATGDEKTQITEYTYNTSNWIVALPKHTYLLDAQGLKVSEKWFYYDNSADFNASPLKGLLTKEETLVINPVLATTTKISSQYAYNQYGNIISTTNPLNHTTETTYDTLCNIYPVQVTNALNQTVKTVYYGVNETAGDNFTGSGLFGQVKLTQDVNNQKNQYTYDSLGRILKVFGPLDYGVYTSIIYDYDLSSMPIKVTKSVKIEYQYYYIPTYQYFDGLGRTILTKSYASNFQVPPWTACKQIISGITTYNLRGQVKEKYIPYFANENETYVPPTYNTPHNSLNYDALGRLVRSTNPDLTYSTVSYSTTSKTITDENNHSKTEHYDAYGKVIKVEEFNNNQTYTTNYEYDTLGNLTKVIDNQNNITQIWYDSLGRKIKMDDPDMGIWRYLYDDAGNLIEQTDAKNQTLTFEYDFLNRLTAKRSTLNPSLAIYSYDDIAKPNCIGRLSKITDNSGSSEFFYDVLGREVKSIKTVQGVSYAVQREYDAIDRVTKLTYPDNTIIQYQYTPQGIMLVWDITDENNTKVLVSGIDYSPTGQILKIRYGNNTETTYTYNPNTLRLTNLITQSPYGKIQDLNYGFDDVGNVTGITDLVNTGTQTFQYDDLNRLTNATGNYGSFNYIYDSIGNMTNKEGVVLNYGKSGRIPHAVTQYGSTLIDYDANGNTIKKGNNSLTYDIENRLSKVEDALNLEPIILNLTLHPGWNFISLPVIPVDTKISSIFSSISGKYDQISRYNSTTKTFEHYVANPKYDQFNQIEYGRGYQIYITDSLPVTLSVSGTLPQTQSLQLKTGYNLIFCPKTAEIDVEKALKPLNLGVDYSKVIHYNKSTARFEKYDSSIQEFGTLKPGESYYIYCLKDTVWDVSNVATTTSFVYDGDGGRVKKFTQATGDPGQETIYIGSLFEKQSIVDGQWSIVKHIYAGSNRICTIDNRQSTVDYRYFHSDHLGSSNVITDSNGNKISLTEYKPYGAVSKQIGIYEPKYKFTGKELDTTGLYFYGARYMDPQLGRFISPDTIVQAPYDPQSLNRYSYCRNNPINYVDPTGHWFWALAFAIIKGAMAGAAIGTAVAAATGGNIGQGALTGAISGVVFGSIGFGVGKFGITGLGKTAVHAFGGAISGTINTSIAGGDLGMNALVGGLSAGASQWMGSNVPFLQDSSGNTLGDIFGNTAKRAATGAIVGGSISAAFGGEFGEGARQGAMTSAIAYNANCAAGILVEIAIQRTFLLMASVVAFFSSPQVRTNIQRAINSLSLHFAKGAERKGDKIEKGTELSPQEAAERVRQGKDVFADSKEEAESIAREAGNGNDPIPEGPHRPGYSPHYHTNEHGEGHVFY